MTGPHGCQNYEHVTGNKCTKRTSVKSAPLPRHSGLSRPPTCNFVSLGQRFRTPKNRLGNQRAGEGGGGGARWSDRRQGRTNHSLTSDLPHASSPKW
ncbi:BQ5605_C026g10175 [Microbotryum silenes-dioicae]|uniref:BQ5605_C026g10175 protein n=1 Tax=Microbotryum silenes-dioicae TaxID=796604 RepID=A0A2X0MRE4_9BASI|nr:BQ5605_C026g10175 [Microbotryum silenes-dioicae]